MGQPGPSEGGANEQYPQGSSTMKAAHNEVAITMARETLSRLMFV